MVSVNPFQGDISKLSDEDLKTLLKELEDAGFASIDPCNYDEGEHAWQARYRAEAIRDELACRAFSRLSPEEQIRHAERVFVPMVNVLRPKLQELLERSDGIAELFKRGNA